MFSMKRGGVLVTCGSTTGVNAEINLFQLYQRQLRLIGSLRLQPRATSPRCSTRWRRASRRPVIDTVIGLDEIDAALARLESRDVFGKIIVTL